MYLMNTQHSLATFLLAGMLAIYTLILSPVAMADEANDRARLALSRLQLKQATAQRDEYLKKLLHEHLKATKAGDPRSVELQKALLYQALNISQPTNIHTAQLGQWRSQLASQTPSFILGLYQHLYDRKLLTETEFKKIAESFNRQAFTRIKKEMIDRHQYQDAIRELEILAMGWHKPEFHSPGWEDKANKTIKEIIKPQAAAFHDKKFQQSKLSWGRYFHERMRNSFTHRGHVAYPKVYKSFKVTGRGDCGPQYQMFDNIKPPSEPVPMMITININKCGQSLVDHYAGSYKKKVTKSVPVYGSTFVGDSTSTSGYSPQMGQTSKCLSYTSDGRCQSRATVTSRGNSGKSDQVFTTGKFDKQIIGYENRTVYEDTPNYLSFMRYYNDGIVYIDIGGNKHNLYYQHTLQDDDKNGGDATQHAVAAMNSVVDTLVKRYSQQLETRLASLPKGSELEKDALAAQVMMIKSGQLNDNWGNSDYLRKVYGQHFNYLASVSERTNGFKLATQYRLKSQPLPLASYPSYQEYQKQSALVTKWQNEIKRLGAK